MLIKDSYSRCIKPTFKQGLSVLASAQNVYQYLVKVHQQYSTYKGNNQRSRTKKVPFLLPCTAQESTSIILQNYEETVYEAEINGANILYQFE